MNKIRLLIWADAVIPTGWSTVMKNITKNLNNEDYDISWIGINYFGDPHEFPYRIYPAASKGDLYGFNRFQEILAVEKPEIIFLLNDIWVIDGALKVIKQVYRPENRPKIVVYFPVDAKDHDSDWYKNLDFVDKVVVYNQFGKEVAQKAREDIDYNIIWHGVDTDVFFPIENTSEIKQKLYGIREAKDFFIVLSAMRNQPRKLLDVAMTGFALFAKDKDTNVKLHMHAGLLDAHINISKMATRLDINKHLLITSKVIGVQALPESKLNLIYNVSDIGLTTSMGEGWGLPPVEHSVTMRPQIVPDHSACKELFDGVGILIPTIMDHTIKDIMTTGRLVSPEDVAEKLELLYKNEELRKSVGKKCYDKFTTKDYSWKEIGKQWDKLFKELL